MRPIDQSHCFILGRFCASGREGEAGAREETVQASPHRTQVRPLSQTEGI